MLVWSQAQASLASSFFSWLNPLDAEPISGALWAIHGTSRVARRRPRATYAAAVQVNEIYASRRDASSTPLRMNASAPS